MAWRRAATGRPYIVGRLESRRQPDLLHGNAQLGQDQPGVTEDGGGGGKVLPKLPGVDVDVDDRQARRDRFGPTAQATA